MTRAHDRELERPLRVAIAGLGAIGLAVAEALDRGIAGCEFVAVSANNRPRAAERMAQFRRQVPIVAIEDLEPLADMVIECAPAEVFRAIAEPFLANGKLVVALSAGAILSNEDLIETARRHGGQIMVPTGALIGLDAVTAAAVGTIHSVTMITRKPVRGLLGAPYLAANGIDIESIVAPLCVFKGTAREAAIGFPANLNVAVALSLAGIGPDATTVEIWADPDLQRNTHRIEVESDSANFTMSIENIPSENPKTGRITAQAVIALLTKLRAPLRIGT